MGYNKAIVVGNLGKDPVLRHTQSGRAVVNLSVCSNERFGTDDNGNAIEKKEWFRVVAWNALAEAINKNFQKGRAILLEGRMQTRKYDIPVTAEVTLDNGNIMEVDVVVTKEVTELIASRFEFLDEGTKWGTSSGASNKGSNRVKAKVKPKQNGNSNSQSEPDYEPQYTPDEIPDEEIPF